jgi:hypothetical protein
MFVAVGGALFAMTSERRGLLFSLLAVVFALSGVNYQVESSQERSSPSE